MRILLIHQYFLELDDSGGSRFNEMTKSWSESGHDITVLAGMMHANAKEKRSEYKGKYFVKKYHDKVEVLRCHISESYNTNFLGRLWGYFSFVFSGIYFGLFNVKGKYDIILVTSPPLFVGITAYVLSLFKRIPIVFEVRDLWPESAIDTGVLTNKTIIKLAYWFESFIYRKAKLINVLTPAFREKLVNDKKVPSQKVIFIPNAADFAISDKLLVSDFSRDNFRKLHNFDDKMVFTYVGAHGVANHLIQVIDTAEILQNEGHDKVLFLLIGDGMDKEKLKKQVEIRKLQNIRLIDPVPKQLVFEYILASDVGMSVLKKVDTFKTVYSNKTFDYMACKRPILMAIDGVSRELVEDARCGVYVEPEDTQDFKDKVLYFLNLNRDELKQMGESGYSYAKKYFDREVLANAYLLHLKKVTS